MIFAYGVTLIETGISGRREAIMGRKGPEGVIEIEGEALVMVAAVGFRGGDGHAEWKRSLLEEVAQV